MYKNPTSRDIVVEGITKSDQLKSLLTEYDSLRAEIRVLLQEQTKQLTVFSAIILGVSYFAFSNDSFKFTIAAVPFLLITLGYLTIAQAFMQTCIAGQIQRIEKSVRRLNAGVPLLTWDHLVVPRVMVPVILRLGPNGKRRFLNPIPIAIAQIAIAVACISGFTGFTAFQLMQPIQPWNYVYAVLLILLHIFAAMHLVSLPNVAGQISKTQFD